MLKAFLDWWDGRKAQRARDAARTALLESKQREAAELQAWQRQCAIEAAQARRANARVARMIDAEAIEQFRIDQHRRDIADMKVMRAGQRTEQASWPAGVLQQTQHAALQQQENQWAAQRLAQVVEDAAERSVPLCGDIDSRPPDSGSYDCGNAAASE